MWLIAFGSVFPKAVGFYGKQRFTDTDVDLRKHISDLKTTSLKGMSAKCMTLFK